MTREKLIKKVGGKLYGLRPGLYSQTRCVFCGRAVTVGKDPRASGFRSVAFKRHIFSCYEKALAALGYKEGKYDEKTKLHRLEPV